MSNIECLLEQLTVEATEAARQGQWDRVIALYNQRGAKGQQSPLSPKARQTLMESDQWLITRIQEAQAAIKQQLLDIQDQRRRLTVLKRQWGESPTTPARHLLTI
ncbi:MAG TPA: hypothetical protein PKK23_00890 [Nitrospirales bacterium]|nr:hypothetical protein [Nitrospiraceae bacterium]HNP27567.1 hypothetical protein [Nitrospirales bacterium]